jgi:hypothetical protein
VESLELKSAASDSYPWSYRLCLFLKANKEAYKLMPLIQLIAVLIVVGVILGLINRFIPMAQSIKSILNAIVVIAVVLWLLKIFGILSQLSTIHVGK